MVCLGLAFTNHLNTIVCVPGLLFLLWKGGALKKLTPKKAGMLLLAFALPLLLYLYLPVRSAANPVMDTGNPQTWYNFRLHTTGYVFRFLMFSSSPEQIAQHALTCLVLLWKQFRLALLLLPVGVLFYWKRHRTLLAVLAVIAGFNFLWGINYAIADIDTYYLAIYMIFSILMAGALARVEQENNRMIPMAAWTAAGAFLLITFLLHLPLNNAAGRSEAWRHGMNLLKAPEPGSLVLTDTDFNGFPMLYLHYVEHVRPDLTLLHYPPDFWDIENGVSKEARLPTFQELARGMNVVNGEIQFRSDEFKAFIMNWILDHNLPDRAVYSTYSPEAPVRWDANRYTLVHFGLMGRFAPAANPPSAILFIPPYDMAPLTARRYAERADEAGRDEILLRYAWNQCYQGDAYFEAKDLRRSSLAYEEALKNPQLKDHPEILLSLGRNAALQGDTVQARMLLEKSRRSAPDNPLVYQYLFNCAILDKDMTAAAALLNEALGRFPDNAYFLSMRDTLARQGGIQQGSHP